MHRGDVMQQRIGSQRGRHSRSGHLHQRELLRIDTCRRVLHLEQLLLDGAPQNGGVVRLPVFQFVVGRDIGGLRRGNRQPVQVLGVTGEATAGSQELRRGTL